MPVIVEAVEQKLTAAYLPAVFSELGQIFQIQADTLCNFIVVKGPHMRTGIQKVLPALRQAFS